MKIKFSELKKMDVISVTNGKHLGRVCDITITSPENAVLGFTASGGRGFKFNREEVYLPVSAIIKIGEDVILADIEKKPEPRPPRCPPPKSDRRSYDEYE